MATISMVKAICSRWKTCEMKMCHHRKAHDYNEMCEGGCFDGATCIPSPDYFENPEDYW